MKTSTIRQACAVVAMLIVTSATDAGPLRRAVQRIRFGPPVIVIETAEPPLSAPRFVAPAPLPMPQKPGVAPVETKPAKPPQVAKADGGQTGDNPPPKPEPTAIYSSPCPGGVCGDGPVRRFIRR